MNAFLPSALWHSYRDRAMQAGGSEQASAHVEIVAVLGSVTPPGRLQAAVAGMLERASAQPGVDTRLLDLADLRVAAADGRPPEQLGDDTASIVEQVSAADAVIFATPVYRGSLTGVLKNLLDQLPVASLQGKAVGIISMGAGPQHYLGAERHLRDVLAFFGVVLAPVACYLVSADFEVGVPSAAAVGQLDELLQGLVALALALRGAASPLGPAVLGRLRA
jgi:FMN reductase